MNEIEFINSFKELINTLGLNTESRKRELVYGRYIFIYHLSKIKFLGKPITLNQIGYIFNRDHASIIHAKKKYEDLKNYDDFNGYIEYYSKYTSDIINATFLNIDFPMREIHCLCSMESLIAKKLNYENSAN